MQLKRYLYGGLTKRFQKDVYHYLHLNEFRVQIKANGTQKTELDKCINYKLNLTKELSFIP